MSLVIETSHDLGTFEADWPALNNPGAGSHYVFQTADVLKIWQRTIGAARGVVPTYVRVADVEGRTRMLLPLGVEERHGAKVLLPLDGGVSDYNTPIMFDGGTAFEPRLLLRRLRAALPAVDVVMLDKMPMQAAYPLATRPRKANCAYEIDLSTTWEAYFATQRHRPKDSRRKRRRLAELGPVRFLLAQSELERERIFHAMIAQKTRRYLEKNGTDGFDRPGYRAYFREMTSSLHPRGHVHLSALEVGGELAATHWGLIANGRFYCLMLAFANGDAARYSPASLLVEELIAWSFAHGLRSFDLGVGEAEWKRHFGAKRVPLTQHHEAVTPLGWAYLNARKLRDSLGAGQPPARPRIAPASRPIRTSAQAAS